MALTQMERGIRTTRAADNIIQAWGIGAEVVLFAAMNNDTDLLDRISQEHEALDPVDIILEGKDNRTLFSYIGEGVRTRRILEAEDNINPGDITALVQSSKQELGISQALSLSRFFKKRLQNNGGESVESLNKRMLVQALLTLRPYAVELGRIKSDTHNGYEFYCNSKKLPEWQHEPDNNNALTYLHAILLEYDALVALDLMVKQKNARYIPILAGPLSEQSKLSENGENLAADALLIRDDGQEVIPVQVKVHAFVDTRKAYSDRIVIVDSTVLKSWEPRTVIDKDKAGKAMTGTRAEYIAGKIVKNAAKVFRTKKVPKNIPATVIKPAALEALYTHINNNPHHSLN